MVHLVAGDGQGNIIGVGGMAARDFVLGLMVAAFEDLYGQRPKAVGDLACVYIEERFLVASLSQ
jgi:hypothetical protein